MESNLINKFIERQEFKPISKRISNENDAANPMIFGNYLELPWEKYFSIKNYKFFEEIEFLEDLSKKDLEHLSIYEKTFFM